MSPDSQAHEIIRSRKNSVVVSKAAVQVASPIVSPRDPLPSSRKRLPKIDVAGGQISRSMITPEIAAYVVKEYLLPMFES
mgnify:CR=1 FL=1